ncbi:hypothetical protein CNR22_18655 [Sphingobacteriaceae bacterium]|nr:hypothetical protein CNR22_18655 [Sphingobacteriaceae bacterium]
MKLILAPTDFSKTARNALNYAAELAKRTKSKLVLFHACHPAIPITSGIAEATVFPMTEDLEKDSKKRLNRVRLALHKNYGPKLSIETVCVLGLAADVVLEYAKEKKADLIVVGTHGANYLEEKLLGSVTSELIKNASVPVLSIAAETKFKSLKKFVLATDYEPLESDEILFTLKHLAELFKSHIYILNITKEENSTTSVGQAVQGLKLERLLAGQDHSFHSAVNKDVVKGITNFAETHRVDMIVMFPHHRSFMQEFFKKRNSKAMAFHTETPLLTIHN